MVNNKSQIMQRRSQVVVHFKCIINNINNEKLLSNTEKKIRNDYRERITS